jgi:hypothetical protein
MVEASSVEGAVDRDTVIKVLMASGVVISVQHYGTAPSMLVLSKDGYFESREIPLVVHKRLLHYFKRKFGVEIKHFYNPHLILQQEIQ